MAGISAVWNPLCTSAAWVSAPCSCMLSLYCWGAAQRIFVVSICPDLWPLVYPSRLMSFLLPSGGEVSIRRKLLYTFIFPGVGVLVYKWNCWGSCPQMTGKRSVRTVSQLRRERIEGANFPPKAPWAWGCSPARHQLVCFVIYLLTQWSNIHKKLLDAITAAIATANICLI